MKQGWENRPAFSKLASLAKNAGRGSPSLRDMLRRSILHAKRVDTLLCPHKSPLSGALFVRAGRIELPSRPWQGRVLPLNHARNILLFLNYIASFCISNFRLCSRQDSNLERQFRRLL